MSKHPYKLFHFLDDNRVAIGAEYEGVYYELPAQSSGNIDILQYCKTYPEFTGGNELNLERIEFLSPIIKPGKIICVGLNYLDHAKETGREIEEFPTFFCRLNNSYVPHKHDMILSDVSCKYDYEGELAVIIGDKIKQESEEEAKGKIAGYSIFNDTTARDYQSKTSQWFIGKNFDNMGSFGPFLVPSRFLPVNAIGLEIVTKINGEIRQNSNTKNMICPPSKLLSILSQMMTLEAGDVVITGTPAGVGFARNPRVYLQNGDLCSIYISEIGTLENKIKINFKN